MPTHLWLRRACPKILDVGAVSIVAGSHLRDHRRSTVALTLLVAVAVALVLAAVAGARRTASAIDGFVAATSGADGYVAFTPEAFGGTAAPDLGPELEQVLDTDGVARASRFVLGYVQLTGPDVPTGSLGLGAYVPIDPEALGMIGRMHLVDGRLPDQEVPEEVVIDEELARDARLRVGSTVALTAPSNEQLFSGSGDAAGGLALDAEVVGIVRRPIDLRDPQDRQVVPNDYSTHPNIYLSAAFWSAADGDVAVFNPIVAFEVEPGAAADEVLDALATGTGAYPISPDRFLAIDGTYNGVERSADLHARGMQVFALVLALAGVFIVGQTLGRQILVEAADDPTLLAVGMTPAQLSAVAVLRAVPVAVAGAVLGAAGAIALSPLAPLPGTVARRAELHPGVHVDALVLGPGLVAAVVVVLLASVVPSLRATGRRRRVAEVRRPTFAARLAAAGLPAPAAVGVRFALEPGSGRTAVPARTALVAAITTVTLVVTAVGFSTSLRDAEGAPERFGVTWDVAAGAMTAQDEVDAMADAVEAIPGVAAFGGLYTTALESEFGELPTVLTQHWAGEVVPLITRGSAPGAGEVAVGALTMQEEGLEIGDDLQFNDPIAGRHAFRISGEVVLNVAGLDVSIPPGRGVLLDWSAIELLSPGESEHLAPSMFIVATEAGRTRSVEAALRELFPTSTRAEPVLPLDLANIGDASLLPAALGAVVAVLGFGAVAHALLSAVGRRRHELAILKSLGFVRSQTRGAVVVQAMTFGLLALVAGIPLGIAGGRTAWGLAAHQIGIPSHPVSALGSVTAVAVLALVALALVALVPARQALRVPAAAALRNE